MVMTMRSCGDYLEIVVAIMFVCIVIAAMVLKMRDR
jgi:hypothetical protein